MRAEQFWQRAKAVSATALQQGALVPLSTRVLPLQQLQPFVVRELLSATPRHLRMAGPRPNPFLPWDQPLEVERLAPDHVLLLNKYPVQEAHLLIITRRWRAQSGWLDAEDWQAVAHVAADTGGLWFFNSGPRAGASQPHRHLQLLPRPAGEASCPLADALLRQLQGDAPAWPWAYRISARRDPLGGSDLPDLYAEHCRSLALGAVAEGGGPQEPYNLLFDDDWFLTVKRSCEHCAGFSINALGFAGYLLHTRGADLDWLHRHGPWSLLEAVAVGRE